MVERTVKIEFETTAADYRRVLLWFQRTRLMIGATVYLLVAVSIVWFLTVAGGGPSGQEGSAPATVFFFLLILPVFLGASLFWQVWWRARKVEKVAEPGTAIFSNSGLRLESLLSSSESAWESYHRAYATPTDFILFPQDKYFFCHSETVLS